MAKVEFRARLADDRSVAAIQTLVDDGVVASTALAPDDLARFVQMLAALRAQLAQQVPAKPEALPPAVKDPALQLQRSPETGELTINIRHPGYGWLSFQLTAQSTQALAEWFRRN
jgi:hypothetical protein